MLKPYHMKNSPSPRIAAVLIFSSLIPFVATAQQSANIIRDRDSLRYASHVDFHRQPGNAPIFTAGRMTMYRDSATFEIVTNMRQLSQETDADGVSHYRWQELLGGIAIEGARYTQHVRNGRVLSQSGCWLSIIDVKTKTPALSEQQALAAALRADSAGTVYAWQSRDEESFLRRIRKDSTATYLPKGELVYYGGEGLPTNSALRLAYKFAIAVSKPYNRRLVFVDAATGAILVSRSLIEDADVPATASTAYSSTQSIQTTNIGSAYSLKETGRGMGIATYNTANKTSITQAVDFTNSTTSWTNFNPIIDQYATDAHWGLEKTYDYYLSKYGRNSVDNSGLALLGYVHVNLKVLYPSRFSNNNNAFWDQISKVMQFGDGETGYHPFVSMDIVGHELTHGVTQFSSQLPNSSEGGALNESFSDMMGVSVRYYAKGALIWTIGDQTNLTLRDLSNPKAYNEPNTYGGPYWVNTVGCTPTNGNDGCGVHTNLGVGNYWFYLLTQGGSGANDLGHAYNVTALGLDKARDIAYSTWEQHLISTSVYTDARTESIDVAQSKYSVGSIAERSVTNAWYAVGVGNAYPAETISGDFLPFTCINGTTTFSIGNPNAALSYSWTVSNGLQIVGSATGSTVTVKVIGNGYNFVMLNVVTALSGTEMIVKKQVLVGIPPLDVNATVDRTPQASHYQYLTATVTQLPNTLASSYSWYLEVNGSPTTLLATGLQLRNYPIPPCTTIFYRCQLTTPCGTAVYSTYAYNTYCNSMLVQDGYVAYPNPANDVLTVTNTASQQAQSTSPASIDASNSSSTAPVSFSIVLYDVNGNILRNGQAKPGESQITLDTQNIQNGTYYLHIMEGSKLIERQIIINHQ